MAGNKGAFSWAHAVRGRRQGPVVVSEEEVAKAPAAGTTTTTSGGGGGDDVAQGVAGIQISGGGTVAAGPSGGGGGGNKGKGDVGAAGGGGARKTSTVALRPVRNKTDIINAEVVKLRANHYKVHWNFASCPLFYHYDLTIWTGGADEARVRQRQAAAKAAVAEDGGDDGNKSNIPERIVPKIWKEFLRVHGSQFLAEECKPAFDFKKNVYTTVGLVFRNGDSFTGSLEMQDPDDDDPEKRREFTLTIKPCLDRVTNLRKTHATAALDEFMTSGMEGGRQAEQPQDVVQALDIALRYHPTELEQFFPLQRSFFNIGNSAPLTPTLNILYGHYQSLQLSSRPTLNVDLATKAFYNEMSLLDFFTIIAKDYIKIGQGPSSSHLTIPALRRQLGGDATVKKFIADINLHLRGKMIKYGTGNQGNGGYEMFHRFRANGIVDESATTFTFAPDSSQPHRKINIQQYMQAKDTHLATPELPCVHIGNKSRTNYVPMELCFIEVQPYKGKMSQDLTTSMIKRAATRPKDRFQRIQAQREACEFHACAVLRNFGLQVDMKPMEVDGHRLGAPRITVGKAKSTQKIDVCVDKVRWSWSYLGQMQFLTPARNFPEKWAVIDLTYQGGWNRDMKVAARANFVDALMKMGRDRGLVIRKNPEVIVPPRPRNNGAFDYKGLFRSKKSQGYTLLILIMSNDGREYKDIKMAAETQAANIGILTSCIKERNVFPGRDRDEKRGPFPQTQTLANFLLKLNVKLNGENFEVKPLLESFMKIPTMVIGSDVTHPAPNSDAPSVAAVASSVNRNGMGYHVDLRIQKEQRREVIDDMADILKKNLIKYHQTNRLFPKRIFVYRDGVSEGYFNTIKEVEYEAMRKACEEIIRDPKEPQPKITFIIVKKRHHTRFDAMDMNGRVSDKNDNVQPGVVVMSSDIVHPTEKEFYLNSHVGIQGTSKPTRYHVIHDDNNFSMQELADFSYYLCYGFVRCTQPVSYPCATYYAHLAAYRARNLLQNEGPNADLRQLEELIRIHPELQEKYPMFFS